MQIGVADRSNAKCERAASATYSRQGGWEPAFGGLQRQSRHGAPLLGLFRKSKAEQRVSSPRFRTARPRSERVFAGGNVDVVLAAEIRV